MSVASIARISRRLRARPVRTPVGRYAIVLAGLLVGCTPGAQRAASNPGAPAAPAATLSDSDLELADAAVQRALQTGTSGEHFSWSNAATGHAGEVWVTRTYRLTSGGWCREYREAIRADGRVDAYADRACRTAASAWVIVD